MSPTTAAAYHRLWRPRPPPQPQGSPSAALLLLLAALLVLLTTMAASVNDVGGGGALVQPAAAPAPEEASFTPPPVPVPARRRAPTRHRMPRDGQQHEYDGEEPLLIVGTVDGRVHAVGSGGDVVWSFDSGAPLVSSYYAGWEEGDYTGGSSNSNVPVVIPAVDGSLLVHTPGKGVQRLPLSASQLVERAPFLAGDGTLYTGARTSEALMVDLASGKVLQRFSGPSADKIAHMVDPRLHPQQRQQPPQQQNESGADNSKAPAPSPGAGGKQSPRQLLWLGRVEYSLRALDPATGHELWNLTVSDLSPLFPGAPSGSGSGAAAGAVQGGSGGKLPAGDGGKGGKGGKGDTAKGALPPGRTGAGGTTSKALLDVLGPGPGWGGAGALLATPDGGLHRRDPTTGRVRLLAPLGAAPVSAFVVAPGGGGAGAGANLLAAGGGGVSVPLVHTLTREGEEEDSDASSTASSSGGEDDELWEEWDDDAWGDDGEGQEDEQPKPSKPLWLPAAGGGVLGGSSPTVSIGQLGNGRLFGIVLDPVDGEGHGGGGASVLPHYLQHRHTGGVPGGEGLPSPSPAPPSDGTSTTIPAGGPRPPKPGGTTAPGGPSTGSLPRIHSHAQRDCPAGYPTSLCSLRRTGSGSVSVAGGRPTGSGKPQAPAPSAPALVEDKDKDEDEDEDEDEPALVAASCRPGDPGFPGCLLGVHHLKALEAPPPASSSSSSSSSSGRLPPGTPGSGLLDMCMPPLIEPPPSSSSSSDAGFDWTRPATWSRRAKRDALVLLTLVLGAIIMTVLGGTGTGVDSLWGGSGGIKASSSQQQQSLVPSPSRGGAPDVDAEGNVRVGRLMLSPLVLGYGCHGTIVYRGLLDGRPVAVKRMLRAFHAAADREMRLLIESDGHPNVVRYFLREQAGDFVYLALELCVCSLRDVVARLESWVRRRQLELLQQEDEEEGPGEEQVQKKKKKKRPPREPAFIGGLLPPPASWAAEGNTTGSNSGGSGAAPPQVRAALQQIASGVAHLHSLRIVHRDIKPHNILLSSSSSSASASASASTADDTGSGSSSSSSGGALVLDEVEQLGGYVCKISDMGVGKLLALGQSSFGASSFSAGINHPHSQHELALQQQLQSRQAANGASASSSAGSASSSRGEDNSSSSVPHGPGSVGWQAPEVMMGRLALLGTDADPLGTSAASSANGASSSSSSSSSRRTQAVDIFSLGCVFYTVLVPGGHPFGQWYERERNILTGEPELSPLEASPDAHDLVQAMLQKDPARRPTARMVLGHPFFWDDERRLAFLVDFSDRLELEPADSLLVLAVEAGGADIVGRAGWDRRLHKALLEDGSRYRKYDTASVRDCLRLLRNKRNHFHELPKDVQRLMAPLPGGLYRYFQARFPRLLMHCHGVCVRLLTRDKIFRTYIGGKEIEDDYEEDNASLAALEPPAVVARREQEQGPGDAVEGKGEEAVAVAVAAVALGSGEESAVPPPAIPKGDEELLARVTVFAGGTLATSYGWRGWWRPADHWARRLDAGKAKARPPHLTRQLTDGRFRTRLCQHWETSADPFGPAAPADGSAAVPACPMRRKNKCDFAHGAVELRVKETRRGRWGTTRDPPGPPSLRSSGGEDTIAQARVAERSRAATVMSPGPGGGRGMGGNGGQGGRRPPSSSGQGPPPPLMQPFQQQPPPGMGGMGVGGVDAPSWRRAPQPQQPPGAGAFGGYNGGGYHPPPGPP